MRRDAAGELLWGVGALLFIIVVVSVVVEFTRVRKYVERDRLVGRSVTDHERSVVFCEDDQVFCGWLNEHPDVEVLHVANGPDGSVYVLFRRKP